MATVSPDIIEGKASFTFDGWNIERVFMVTGVTGNGYDKIINAMNTSGVPALGSAHPSASLTDCYLREAIPTIEGKANDIVRIRLIYANATWPTERQQINTIEVGGALSQVQTNMDKEGNVITGSYFYPTNYPEDDVRNWPNYNPALNSGAGGAIIIASGLVTKLLPEHHIVKRIVEYSNPTLKAKLYLGAVNSGPWTLDIGAAARTWLCTQLEGVSNDGGLTWVVTYAFQHREDTWDGTYTFIDPRTGRPPADLGTYNNPGPENTVGITTWQHYKLRNFSQLQL